MRGDDPFGARLGASQYLEDTLSGLRDSGLERMLRELNGPVGRELRAMTRERALAEGLGANFGKTVSQQINEVLGTGFGFRTADMMLKERLGASTMQQVLQDAGLTNIGLRMADAFSGLTVGEFARKTHWAESVSAALGGTMARREPAFGGHVARELEKVSQAASDFISGTNPSARRVASELFGVSASRIAALEGTSGKMSILAGANDVLGWESAASRAAVDSLLGRWHSRPDLPAEFWSSAATRRKMYRDADVDEGLAEASPAAAAEIIIDSGVASGTASERGSPIILVEYGGVSISINARQPRLGAFRAIDAFEEQLRAFITRTFEKLDRPDWFKKRVPPDIFRMAKEKRQTAMRQGEAHAPLLDFTDLGQLLSIITRKDNWREAFQAAFGDPDEFRIDLGRLIASRRPTMHVRSIDGLRLTEIVLTANRLAQKIMRLDAPAFQDDDR